MQYSSMKNFKAWEHLTTETERAEVFYVIKQTVKLRVERPQSNFRGGWLRMWTIVSPFYDKKGYSRFHGTFTTEGLIELGIIKQEVAL